MGTNYYDESGGHICKVSAAGPYCWDCDTTLCVGGKDQVHYSDAWYDKCPICNAPIPDESLDSSAAGQQLGFAGMRDVKPHGITSVCSVTWAVHPRDVVPLIVTDKIIRDEYGREYSATDFFHMLECNCPLWYYDAIGREFS